MALELATEETETARQAQLDSQDHAAASGRVHNARDRLELLRDGALERLQVDGDTAWLTEPQVRVALLRYLDSGHHVSSVWGH